MKKYLCYDIRDKDGNFLSIPKAKDYQTIDPNLEEAIGISDKKILQLLTASLNSATGFHHQVDVLHAPFVKSKHEIKTYITRTDYKKTINKLRRALNKIHEDRGKHSKAIETIYACYAALPKIYTQYFDTFIEKKFLPCGHIDHQFCYRQKYLMDQIFSKGRFMAACLFTRNKPMQAVPLIRIIDDLIADLSVGEDGKNRLAKRYIGGIYHLARDFKEAMPSEKIVPYIGYDKKHSTFHKLVLFWLAGLNVNLKTAERHIKNAIERYEIKP